MILRLLSVLYLLIPYFCFKFNIDEVVEEINEKHMTPWGEVCQQDGVYNTPLTPYIEKVTLFTALYSFIVSR
jgi:hypothetical protein